VGYGDGYADVDALPFYKHFYAGGFGSVRGYDDQTLGPTDVFQSQIDELAAAIPTREEAAIIVDQTNLEAGQTPTEAERDRQIEARIAFAENQVVNLERFADPFGGNLLVEGAAEFIFPMPFVKDTRSIRTLFFVDGGNVFDTNRRRENDSLRIRARNLRYSVGLGLSWLTAIGPLTFTYGKAINDQNGDDTQGFQFALGQAL